MDPTEIVSFDKLHTMLTSDFSEQYQTGLCRHSWRLSSFAASSYGWHLPINSIRREGIDAPCLPLLVASRSLKSVAALCSSEIPTTEGAHPICTARPFHCDVLFFSRVSSSETGEVNLQDTLNTERTLTCTPVRWAFDSLWTQYWRVCIYVRPVGCWLLLRQSDMPTEPIRPKT